MTDFSLLHLVMTLNLLRRWAHCWPIWAHDLCPVIEDETAKESPRPQDHCLFFWWEDAPFCLVVRKKQHKLIVDQGSKELEPVGPVCGRPHSFLNLIPSHPLNNRDK